jgi:hypothetical protein
VPGGEIWLTDGLSYKFVLKTSNEVLIATYDNIVGINSNFVNFLTEQEIQTATAGQTVFTLTTMQYQPDANNLSVYVDGVNQYGPGSSYAYVETNSTTVTFTTGLHVGAEVKFTTAQSLSSGATDASLVTYDPPFTGSVTTTVENKLSQTVSPEDFGAVGDGVTDDTAAFTLLEAAVTGRDIDLQNKSYYVTVMPEGNQYYSGQWVLPSGTSRLRWQGAQLTGAGRIAFGDGALEDLPITYSTGADGTVVAMGYNAMANMTQVKKSIAIGTSAQENGTISRDNIAIGDSALKNVQSVTADYSQTQQEGTRNVGIGGNALYFVTDGVRNTAVGRNTGSCLTGDDGATAYGANAYGGYAPIGLSDEIENWAPTESASGGTNYSVAIGSEAMQPGITDYCVAVGGEALSKNKKSFGNVAIGPQTLTNLDVNTWYNGGLYTTLGIDGTYTQSGTTITLNIASHTLVPGDIALFRLLDGGSQTFANDIIPAYVATTPNGNQFTITSPKSLTSSGSARLYAKASAAQQPTNDGNTAVGGLAAANMQTGIENSTIGYRSMNDVTNATRNVALGFRALSGLTEAINCTAVGHDSLRFMVDGTVASGTGTNRTGLGINTRVSGDNQLQLGNAATTTYAFGAVQNRSDIRDKADIRATRLGLDFIEKLRPVDFKWDYRDDYFDYDEEGNLVKLPKDGTKKRTRYHHGLIAQDVKQVCDELGLDFGGYQDHAVNNGCDVKTIGYEELIAPLIKAVQELSEEVKTLKAQIKE